MTTTAATKARTSKATTTPKSGVKSALTPAEAQKLSAQDEQARLDSLVMAVKVGFTALGSKGTATQEAREAAEKAVSLAEQAEMALNNTRVTVARAVAMLATHPATFAASGPTKGQPALSKVAALTGYPRNTLRPLWEAGEVFTAKKWAARTTEPTDAERKVVIAAFAEKQTTRKANDAEKESTEKAPTARAAKTINAGTLEDVVEAADTLHKVVEMFTKEHGLTDSQLSGLSAKLDMIHDLLEQATANGEAAAAE